MIGQLFNLAAFGAYIAADTARMVAAGLLSIPFMWIATANIQTALNLAWETQGRIPAQILPCVTKQESGTEPEHAAARQSGEDCACGPGKKSDNFRAARI